MRINESARVAAMRQYQQARIAQAEDKHTGKSRDQVSISPEAKEMLASNRLEAVGRTERLIELKQAVATGTYSVDAGRLADRLLPYLFRQQDMTNND